jgi:hypothetical protein
LKASKVASLILSVAAATAVMIPRAASAAITIDGPGMRYGSDSWPMPVTGHGPYGEPVLGSGYGGYMGMAGNWARKEGCPNGNFLAWSAANSTQANVNYTKHHIGVGTGVYWYMGGPGVDPHWKDTAREAASWGTQQAKWALAAMSKLHVTYPVVWADIEMPEIAPAPDNGWNAAYTAPCSGIVRAGHAHTPAATDRAEFNAFANYITQHSKYKVGVYSAPSIWTSIFGTGNASSIKNTYEWTYWPETPHLSNAPVTWCLRNGAGCAQFFGGQTSKSKYALMWQWSGGGGIRNGVGDFDQIDVARMK